MIPVFMISSFNISPQNIAIFGKLSAKTAVVTRSASTIASVTSSGCVIGDNADTWSISFR